MAYDHHAKAGNQGDCVKHPALIAALDGVLAKGGDSRQPFHYLDVFAGHASHALLNGDDYEWPNGIGRLSSTKPPDDAPASIRAWWSLWHDAPKWPTTCAGYPGSARIAAHRCREANRPVKLELYDHSEEARRDLERAFPASHAIQDASLDRCLIGQSLELSGAKQDHIAAADFVFIDPPGWQSKEHPCYPRWELVLEHVLKPRGANDKRSTLMWMPAGGQNRTRNKKDSAKENPGAYPWDQQCKEGKTQRRLEQLSELGYPWTAVRWSADSYSACILVYNRAEAEIRAALECVVGMAQMARLPWEKKHSTEVGSM